MTKPILVVSCEADGDEWKRPPDWEKRLRRQLRRAFGRAMPIIFLPPGVYFEVYHPPQEGDSPTDTGEGDPGDEDEDNTCSHATTS